MDNCTTDPVTHATTCMSIPLGCSIDQQTGQVVCVDNPTAPSCIPPLLWQCTAPGQCACAPVQTQVCTVAITYSDPSTPVMAPLPAGCDGAEIALAVILAKLLGAH